MAVEIFMPRLGDTMIEGKVVKWLKEVGDEVIKGEPIVLISTEKVHYELESPEKGILRLILVKEGEIVPVGSVIGIIANEKEDIHMYKFDKEEPPSERKEAVSTITESMKLDKILDEEKVVEKILISPAAKKLAELSDVDYSKITGTGPSGRINRKDIEDFIKASDDQEKITPTTPLKERLEVGKTNVGRTEEEPEPIWKFGNEYPMSRMRQIIARKMSESSLTAPHIYFFTEVNMAKINALRKDIAEKYEHDMGIKISINDILIKLTALNIKDYPLLNAQIDNDKIIILPEINVGLAVALPDGLIVPSIDNADKRSLKEIVFMRKDLVERARNGKLKLTELESGTFTISTLSQFDVFFFTALLNPPQSGILTVGKSQDKPVVINGEIVIRPIAVFGLSVDHRIIDGAVAAAFLQSLKEKLENLYFYLID